MGRNFLWEVFFMGRNFLWEVFFMGRFFYGMEFFMGRFFYPLQQIVPIFSVLFLCQTRGWKWEEKENHSHLVLPARACGSWGTLQSPWPCPPRRNFRKWTAVHGRRATDANAPSERPSAASPTPRCVPGRPHCDCTPPARRKHPETERPSTRRRKNKTQNLLLIFLE